MIFNASIPAKSGFTLIDQSAKRGFTLIELSIVLIIIGLITSGILIGRDLIHAAQVRATVKQVEEFNAAVNTFRGKYNCLPGDCAKAADFGFDAATNGTGDDTIGCGDSALFNCLMNTDAQRRKEHVNFWYHLSAANLLSSKGSPYDGVYLQVAGVVSPPVKINTISSIFLNVAAAGWVLRADVKLLAVDYNLFPPAHNLIIGYGAAPTQFDMGALLPMDAYAIDAKMDDGLPLSGTVVAWSYVSRIIAGGTSYDQIYTTANSSSPYACVDSNTTPPSYNVQSTNPGSLADPDPFTSRCSPMIKAAF